MGFMTRVAQRLGHRSTPANGDDGYTPRGVPSPPARAQAGADPDQALSLGAVYRAIQVIATAVMQLGVHAERSGVHVPEDQARLVANPDVTGPGREAFIEQTVMSLALFGEAFWAKQRSPDGHVVNLSPIDPRLVAVGRETPTGPRLYAVVGKRFASADIEHLEFMRILGALRGLGPVQAARRDFAGALNIRDYSDNWFGRKDTPDGVLSTSQVLPPGQSEAYKKAWTDTAKAGGVRVLGSGLSYAPLTLSPQDAQWLATQSFTTLQIARLFGVPPMLLAINPEGGSKTYSNVEHDSTLFARYTLMRYITEIEAALTRCLPRGQRARFNVDALLRADLKTRYAAHATALQAGFMTVDEVRAIEGLDPLPAKSNPAKEANQ